MYKGLVNPVEYPVGIYPYFSLNELSLQPSVKSEFLLPPPSHIKIKKKPDAKQMLNAHSNSLSSNRTPSSNFPI